MLAGLVAGAAGMFFFQVLLGGAAPNNPDPAISTATVGAAALLTTSLLWSLGMAPGKASARRGAFIGGLAVLIAHPASFLLQALLSLARFGPASGSWLSGLFYAGAASLVLAGFSLLVVGLPSLLIGALLAACAPAGVPVPAAPAGSIQNILWQWTSVKAQSTGQTDQVPNPENYTITFKTDGSLTGQADCNSFNGTYAQQNGFSIKLGAMTKVYCGEASLDQQIPSPISMKKQAL
jgi:heat shock protein HslJ